MMSFQLLVYTDGFSFCSCELSVILMYVLHLFPFFGFSSRQLGFGLGSRIRQLSLSCMYTKNLFVITNILQKYRASQVSTSSITLTNKVYMLAGVCQGIGLATILDLSLSQLG